MSSWTISFTPPPKAKRRRLSSKSSLHSLSSNVPTENIQKQCSTMLSALCESVAQRIIVEDSALVLTDLETYVNRFFSHKYAKQRLQSGMTLDSLVFHDYPFPLIDDYPSDLVPAIQKCFDNQQSTMLKEKKSGKVDLNPKKQYCSNFLINPMNGEATKIVDYENDLIDYSACCGSSGSTTPNLPKRKKKSKAKKKRKRSSTS
ncbi:hypothetical protein PCE1_000606 [Barthelona sp. PCE]